MSPDCLSEGGRGRKTSRHTSDAKNQIGFIYTAQPFNELLIVPPNCLTAPCSTKASVCFFFFLISNIFRGQLVRCVRPSVITISREVGPVVLFVRSNVNRRENSIYCARVTLYAFMHIGMGK